MRVIFHNGETLPEPPALPDELIVALHSARTLAPLPTDRANPAPTPTRPDLASALTAAARRAITAFSSLAAMTPKPTSSTTSSASVSWPTNSRPPPPR